MLAAMASGTWDVMVASAPWLLFGFLLAAVIKVVIPVSWIVDHLRQPGVGSVMKATLIGLPLPLCSCSVMPVGTALRKAGASRGATGSFFVATPEIGVDSFLLSYGLLGPVIAIARLICSAVSAILVGLSLDYLYRSDSPHWASGPCDNIDKHAGPGNLSPSNTSKSKEGAATVCCSKPEAHAPNENNSNHGSSRMCCLAKEENTSNVSAGSKSKSSLVDRYINRYIDEFWTLVRDLSVPLTFGFIAAGCIDALLSPELIDFRSVPPAFSTLIMLVIGIPMYVCSASSTPIAAALIAKGLPVGAALVFLLAGPATNVGTIMVIRKHLGTLSVLPYIGWISCVALVGAAVINHMHFEVLVASHLAHLHHTTSNGLIASSVCALFLSLVVGAGLMGYKPTRNTTGCCKNS